MRNILFSLLLCFCLAVPSWAAEYYMITDIGTSARSIARGNIEGFTNPANSVFENPAGMYQTKNFAFSTFTTTFFGDLVYSSFSFSKRFDRFRFGMGYMTAYTDEIYHTGVESSEFYIIEEFEYNNSVTKFSTEFIVKPNLYLGTSLSLYKNEIYTVEGTGYDFDLGAIYKKRNTTYSFLIRNLLGNTIDYSNTEDNDVELSETSENLPKQITFALMKEYKTIDIFGQLKMNGSLGLTKSGGIAYKPKFLKILELSAGYKEYFVLSDATTNLSLGLNIYLGDAEFYYAFEKSDYVDMDNKSYFSISINI